ncbi:hypothetical protein [Flavihumibacter fluvii]|uniref:hypothetical protein n=1 Tax=Flavihumibacter fluvii TaxID=2838157 RepID=UPI001BDDEEDA|nr:hypothetical protein [Flavihumibacter fluvii]ULQ51774.1 hypothetical protein KJS93_16930 [Flavihumibacter fluvii]
MVTNLQVACNGALLTIASIFFYSMVVMLYVVIRSSHTIYTIMEPGERSGILLANGFSIAYSVAVFSVLMAIISSVAGAVGAIALKKLQLYFNPAFNSPKAVFISCIVAILLLAVIYVVLHILLRERITFQYPETLLFWFVFPAVICFVVSILGGSALNNALRSTDMLKANN